MVRQYVEIKNDTIVGWFDVDESIFGGVDASTMYPPPRFIEVLPPLRSKAAKYDPETQTVVEDATKIEHAREFDFYHVRQKRDKILTDTDWTQGRDSPLSLDEKIKYAHYRTKLRDLTLSDAPFFATWPTLDDAQDPWTLLREKRDFFLESTDRYATIDFPHATDEAKQAWLDYRQALRDLPANTTDPENPVWPQAPTA